MRHVRVRDRGGVVMNRALQDLRDDDVILGDQRVVPDGGHVRVPVGAMDSAAATIAIRPMLTDAQRAVSAAAIDKALLDAKKSGRGPMGLTDEDAARLLGHRAAMRSVLSDRWKSPERLAAERAAVSAGQQAYEQRMANRWRGEAA